jgi:hypothetical protein
MRHAHIFLIAFFLGVFVMPVASTQAQKVVHEPTSATDSEVKVNDKKKSGLFKRTATYKRPTEREGQSLQSNKFKPEMRAVERQGRPIRKKIKNRGRQRNESKIYQRHASAEQRATPRSRNKSTRRPQ